MPSLKNVENILVLENHNHIGDILCSLTLFAALKKKYPNSHITLVAAKTSYPIPFFEINPYIDSVLIFDKSSLKSLFVFLRELRSRKYQIGVVPSTKTVSRTLHIINFIAGSKMRVGVKSIDGMENASHKLLNVKKEFFWKDKHQTIRNLEVVKQIDCDLSEEEIKAIKFNFLEEELSSAKNYLKEYFPDKSKKTIAFHPGAGKVANTWDTNKFIELVIKLQAEYHNYVLITKGEVDNFIVDVVTQLLKKNGIPHQVIYNSPIKKLGAILGNLDLYITNDTGTMHIAGFSGAKIIALFGPTNPNEWAPNGENQFFIKSKSDNINDISVQDVFDLAKKMLGS